jgi:hypothetical protein
MPRLFVTVTEGVDGPAILATADEAILRGLGALVARRLGHPPAERLRSSSTLPAPTVPRAPHPLRPAPSHGPGEETNHDQENADKAR